MYKISSLYPEYSLSVLYYSIYQDMFNISTLAGVNNLDDRVYKILKNRIIQGMAL